jgi:hypothetical protein
LTTPLEITLANYRPIGNDNWREYAAAAIPHVDWDGWRQALVGEHEQQAARRKVKRIL